MNNSNRNTRTLIVSFVLAIMVLIPLRFVEVGDMAGVDQPQVLGDEAQNMEVVLPEADVIKPVLEAPYNEIDGDQVAGCISREDSVIVIASNKSQIEEGNLDGIAIDRLIAEMVEIEAKTCK